MEIDHTSSAAATRLRFPLLDVTRIVAAFAVVLFHWGFLYGVENPATGNHPWPILYPWSQYGYLGVQLFFMISGFLVLQSAYSKSVGGFVRARLVRLYPRIYRLLHVNLRGDRDDSGRTEILRHFPEQPDDV